MATDLDQLQIEIVGKTVSADKAIDRMCLKLTNLQTTLSKLDTNGSVGKLDTLTKSMQNMSNIRFSSVNGLAKSVNELGKIKMSGIINSAVAMRTFGTSVRMLNRIKLTETIPQMSALGNSIVKLAKSASALDKDGVKRLAWGMDKLTRSVSHMMVQFSKLPKIDESVVRMAEAVSKFARTGKSGANAADRLGNAFSRMGNVLSRVSSKIIHFPRMLPRIHSGGISAAKGIDVFRNSLFRLVGLVGGVYGLLRGIKACVDYASHLREVQNVVDVSFGQYSDKIEKFSKNSIRNYGISELAAKQTAGRFQAMGMAAGISRKKMAEMSVEMTRLSADFASFYDRDQSKVATSMESILTGTTKPLRQYGIDLTQATLQEWAMKQGMDANVRSMSQAEKIMLRYNYVLANSKAAQGDFIRTAGTWANQVRILKEQLRQLAGIMGQAFINALKPMLQALNKALLAVTDFVTKVVNALGKIFGWKMETSKNVGIDTELEDAADAAGDLADNTGKAVKNAKALNQQLQKTDELNVLHSNKDLNGGGSGSGGSSPSGSGGGANDDAFKMVDTESAFKSKIKNLEGLGNYIRDTLINELGGIDWNSVYEKAASFGTGLASFMNGLFDPDKNGKYLFGSLGTTIAGCINATANFVEAFSKKAHWKNFGEGVNQGLDNFFKEWDPELTAQAIAHFANGIVTFFINAIPTKKQFSQWGTKLATAINTFLTTFNFKAAGTAINKLATGLLTFLTESVEKVEWDKVGKAIGDFFSGLKASQIVIKFLHLAAALGKGLLEAVNGWRKSDGASFTLALTAVVGTLAWKFGLGVFLKEGLTNFLLAKFSGAGIKASIGASAAGAASTGFLSLTIPIAAVGALSWAIKEGGKEDNWDNVSKDSPLAMAQQNGKETGGLRDFDWQKASNDLDKWASTIDGKAKTAVENWAKSMGSARNKAQGLKESVDSITAPKVKFGTWAGAAKRNLVGSNGKGGVKGAILSINKQIDKLNTKAKNLNNKTISIKFKAAQTKQLEAILKLIKEATGTGANGAYDNPGGWVARRNGGVWNPKTGQKFFASGGFPNSADMFMANENGVPELIGTMGRRTAVASGTEITGIRDAINYSADQEAALLNAAVKYLGIIANKNVTISGKEIGQSARDYAKDYYNRTGNNAFVF